MCGTLSNLHSTARPPFDEDSQASSLAPSDSASQRSQEPIMDPARRKEIDDLLNRVEAPSVRPPCVPPTVMWYFEDCATDKKYGNILTEANRSRPKMALALRDENGNKIESPTFNNIRLISDLIIRQLLEKHSSDHRVIGVKSLTKSVFKSLFHAEYRQAILNLEAQESALRLCARHWKAEVMLSQAFLRRGSVDPEGKHGRSVPPSTISSSDENPSQPWEPLHAVPIPKHWDATNASSKRSHELSPGPKSPGSSQAPKCPKEQATLSGERTSSSLVPAGEWYSNGV